MATKKYEVREGFTFGTRSEYEAGDVLELDESAGVAFADKLKPVSEKRKAENDDDDDKKDKQPQQAFAYLPAKNRSALTKAGFVTQADTDKATDEQLRAVEGMNDDHLKVIRDNKGK